MIKGLGSDIIEVRRIKETIDRHEARFLNRIFTPSEQTYCLHFKSDSARHFAGRFAAKEAISKAIGTGIGGLLSWLDVEILNDEMGKPVVVIAPHIARQIGNPEILLTISHCNEYATATAIWEVN